MTTSTDGYLVHLERLVDDLTEEYQERPATYFEHLYVDTPEPLRRFFSFLHCMFNDLLEEMNERNEGFSNHYPANESRDLLFFIDLLKKTQKTLEDSDYSFKIDDSYEMMVNYCELFLEKSGGSTIPDDFEQINLIVTKGIFFVDSNDIIFDKQRFKLARDTPLGEGSYAITFKYKDKFLKGNFVIKRTKKDISEDDYRRFKNEFNLMKKMSSPYVIEVYYFDDAKREYAMEYADSTLWDWIRKNNTKLSQEERNKLAVQVFKAFEYIHTRKILHRDISPTNILIKAYDDVNIIKISDFGLAKTEDSTLTKINTEFKGMFNDPGLIEEGLKSYKIHHEIYALTKVAYFILTGKTIVDLSGPKELVEFFNKGTNPNPNERYKDVKELRNAFNKIRVSI